VLVRGQVHELVREGTVDALDQIVLHAQIQLRQ
jgi:hypothetical protein